MAGIASAQAEAKGEAMRLLAGLQRDGGVGENCLRTRRLLGAVWEEQRRVVGRGGRLEEVDWLAVGRERGLSVVNCGL